MNENFANENLASEKFIITRAQKEALNNQKAFVIWLTGLSGSGKSTIARHLEVALFSKGIRTLILDGDNTRMSINKDLDFSSKGREENIRRVAEIAKILNDAGIVVITAFISPLAANRKLAKELIGENCMVEIFVDAPLDLCMKRDPKGLYNKALRGDLADFTGINSPYEIPDNPQLVVKTSVQSPVESVRLISNWLSNNHLTQ